MPRAQRPAAQPTHPPLVTTGAGQGLVLRPGCGPQLAPTECRVLRAAPQACLLGAPLGWRQRTRAPFLCQACAQCPQEATALAPYGHLGVQPTAVCQEGCPHGDVLWGQMGVVPAEGWGGYLLSSFLGRGRPVGSWSPWAGRVFYQSFPRGARTILGVLGNGPGSSWPESGPAHPNLAGCLAQVAFPVLSFHSAPQGSAALCRWGREGSWVQTVMVTVLGGSQSSGCLPLGLCFFPSGPLQAVLGTWHGGVSSPVQGPDRLSWRGPRRRVECGRVARGHPGVKLSVPQLHGEQGAAGRQVWGRRGPGGSRPGSPPSHPFRSPSGLLLLPPGLPGGWGGRDLLPAHTCALHVLSCKFSPVTLGAPALAECSDRRP